MEIPAYVDKVSDKALFDKKLKPGKVSKEKQYKELGVTEWKLSNGVTVVLKPTDFKNDEILMAANSPGGFSLASDEELESAKRADDIINGSGISEFSETDLEKMLTGKIVNVSPYISSLYEGFNGSTTPADLETMFQLINLYFTSPREDKDAFQAYMEKEMTILRNSKLSPESAYYDTMSVTLNNYNPRRAPETEETLKQVDIQKAMDFYKSRFADAGDFTFYFVGNFDLATIKPFVVNYLSTLPMVKRKESWRDEEIRYPKGVISKDIRKGKEQKCSVTLVFTGEAEWSIENRFMMQAMSQVLNIKLREKIREDKSGTYGIGGGGNITHYPNEFYSFRIGWGCAPSRAEELVTAVKDLIKEMQEKLVDETYIKKVKEMLKRGYETNLKENRYWLSRIMEPYTDNYDPKDMLKTMEMVDTITPDQIKSSMIKYFDFNNFDKFILYPENN
jgi:zinc protease